ncbi:hypothetical protein AB0M46_07990 [Dactylosporangium sp. NPDC051485]|uniref:hypothetical protein n=1 Tax=Dactylosporangium sp. NPDC051485 TaxID=3154846 RepID=UPI003429AEAE
MSPALPPIETTVLLAAVDALPARLRKKLDDAAAKLAGRPVERDGDRHTVAIDDATTVTLTTAGGVVRAPEAVTCTCLLAPNCLHRAAVLSLAPIHDPAADDSAPASTVDSSSPAPAGSDSGEGASAADAGRARPDTARPDPTGGAGTTADASTADETDRADETGAPRPGDAGAARPSGAPGGTGGTQGGDADGTRAGNADEARTGHAGGTRAGHAGEARAGDVGGAGAGRVDGAEGAVPEEGAVVLTAQQRAAVAQLWRAACGVLTDGVSGAGTVARAALLRAAHEAQAGKVYRAAAAARVVATLLQAGRAGDAHYRLADLGEALRELLTVTHRLMAGGGDPVAEGLVGTARRQYHLAGSLRLFGLCTTAVLAGTGHAGVVTYAADRQGRLWMVADIMPGDARRAARAGGATLAMGETALTHRGLTRAGLVVTGATATGGRQLGAGKGVRAVTAAGAGWHEEPLAGLWAEPVAEQVHRAFEALAVPVSDRPAGADLLFLRVTVAGSDGDVVLARDADGMPLLLRVAVDHPALGYRDNLRVLGRAEGLEMLVIARPDPGRPGTVLPLAVAPPEGTGWHLPAPHGGHADLAFDRLHRSQLPQPSAPGETDADEELPAGDGEREETAAGGGIAEEGWRPAVSDPALHRLTAQVERTVAGGRAMLAFPDGRGPSDADRLRAVRLDAGAALLDGLIGAAADRPRDAFGRLGDDDGTAFARAWLAAATYADAAGRALAEASWLPGDPRLEAPA